MHTTKEASKKAPASDLSGRQVKGVSARLVRIAISSTTIVLLVSFGWAFCAATRGHITVKNLDPDKLQRLDQPFEVRLDKQLADVRPHIVPQIEGVWYRSRKLFGIDKLTFVPTHTFKANTAYSVAFEGVKRVWFGEGVVETVQFTTDKAPGVSQTSLEEYAKDGRVIAMDQKLAVTLHSKASAMRNLSLVVSPEIAGLKRHSADDKTFWWSYDGVLAPDTEYRFSFKDTVQTETLKEYTLRTAPLPRIAESVKQFQVTPADTLRVVFSEAISSDNRPDIGFSVGGTGEWRSDIEYTFHAAPAALKPGTQYEYVVPKGLRIARGGILQEDIKKVFQTNGPVQVIGLSPRGRELAQGWQQIRITFNQAVDRKSAEERLRVSSGTVGGITWQGNTLVAQVYNLGFQRTVHIAMEPGVRPVFGLPSSSRVSSSFTTEFRVVKLNVPAYRQAYAQSCEAANVRMALAYRGIHDSDWNILQKFGYQPRPRDTENNIWDDPNSQFVGDVNGSQSGGTGWGVYAGPVSRAVAQYGRGTTLAYGANPYFVASQIHAGNPVIAWGVWRSGAKIDSWNTPSGGSVSGPIPMHVRLVVGVKGEPGDPIGFYIHDPIAGPLYWTRDQFVATIAAAGPAAQLLAIH